MNRIKLWWVAGAAALAIAGFAGVAATFAQQATPTTTATTFLDRVAQKLGIDTGTLRTAVKDSASDEIDARLTAGDITQAQADQMKERAANAPDDAFGFHGGGPGRGHGGPGMFGGEALATFLGTTTDALRAEMQADGATLVTVAQAHGKSRDELKAFLTTEAQTHVAQEVADGEITQAQADAKLADMTANLDQRIDSTVPQGGFRGGPGGHHGEMGGPSPDSSASPSASTTPTAAN